ncbi:MAG: DUF1697 domain-containing protein [Deltaproteobacteria bacterium]|nr:DUF1697 domain-containing protein [Deltaproteobacteria bacterium]
MPKSISILRGINVAGQKKLSMTDLKALYKRLGFKNVTTYIQSGNVIFDSTDESKTELKSRIEGAILAEFGFHVPVIIRSAGEMKGVIQNCPFGEVDMEENGTKVLVTFLSSEPSPDKTAQLQSQVAPPDKLAVIGKEVYLYCPGGYGKSKLSNQFLESRLKLKATTRNWKTVHRLAELSD